MTSYNFSLKRERNWIKNRVSSVSLKMYKELIPITKIKALMPSLREKKRYVAFEIMSHDDINFQDAKKAVETSCLSYLGELGYGKSGIMFLADKYKNNKGILRVEVQHLNDLKACLALTKDIQLRSLGTSGILNKAEKFIAS
jgi:ribonuclease P/MRP protein subunit POP5